MNRRRFFAAFAGVTAAPAASKPSKHGSHELTAKIETHTCACGSYLIEHSTDDLLQSFLTCGRPGCEHYSVAYTPATIALKPFDPKVAAQVFSREAEDFRRYEALRLRQEEMLKDKAREYTSPPPLQRQGIA